MTPSAIVDNVMEAAFDPANRDADREGFTGRFGTLAADVYAFSGIRVAVFGDLIVTSSFTATSLASREAPVLILNYDSTEIVPGARATRTITLRRRSADRRFHWFHRPRRDRKPPGRCAAALRRRPFDCPPHGYAPTKTRILAGGHSAKQQVVDR